MRTFTFIHYRVRRLLSILAFFAVSLMMAALHYAPYLTARLTAE